MARLVAQLILGNNHVARCDFVWRQPRLKRHLPGRLPDNADDFAFLRSYVVELVLEFSPAHHGPYRQRIACASWRPSFGTIRAAAGALPFGCHCARSIRRRGRRLAIAMIAQA